MQDKLDETEKQMRLLQEQFDSSRDSLGEVDRQRKLVKLRESEIEKLKKTNLTLKKNELTIVRRL